MVAYRTRCAVLTEGTWVERDSTQLLPGDVVWIRGDGWMLPADLLLLNCAAVCDESGLTGEREKAVRPRESAASLLMQK